MKKVKSEWKYKVSFTDDKEVFNEHLIVLKKVALKRVAYAVRKGYRATMQRID